ncbi:hypothetical protein HWQ67_16695, partial [Candidatus Magnetobacterium casensis]
MIKRFCLSMAMAVAATLLVVVPVLAAYYAYIYVEESDGNSYDQVPLSVDCNTTRLAQGDFISSTALDTRVLTGSSEQLPHMVADDKVMFVTDLEAYEDKTLIFYMGATSLSSFPIIVGYNGSFETPDDPDLELGYVMELLIDGYFDTSAGADKNILYKEDAFKVCINGANNLSVQALNTSGAIQWVMSYNNFTTGEHTVYIIANGLGAFLYVDNFVTPKDTENLFDCHEYTMHAGTYPYLDTTKRSSFFYNDLYWAFYMKPVATDAHNIFYQTSSDGASWSGENTIASAGETTNNGFSVWQQGSSLHIAYGAANSGTNDYIYYRHGTPEGNGTITWTTAWQVAVDLGVRNAESETSIAVDSSGYPFIAYGSSQSTTDYTSMTKSSTNNGTWTTAGGYPSDVDWTTTGHRQSMTAYQTDQKMYLLWNLGYLQGKYYSGGWEAPVALDATGTVNYFSAAADPDDNLYIAYARASGSVRLIVRYADGTWSSNYEITASGSMPSVSYNTGTGLIYITFVSGSYIQCITLDQDGLAEAHTLLTPPSVAGAGLSVSPYGDPLGMMYTAGGTTEHITFVFPYQWNDNGNDWVWMQNNVMSYADDIQMAIDGVLQLEYKPDSIIQGTTLPDEQNDNDATITWGTNPTGVT